MFYDLGKKPEGRKPGGALKLPGCLISSLKQKAKVVTPQIQNFKSQKLMHIDTGQRHCPVTSSTEPEPASLRTTLVSPVLSLEP